jgi:hypothetical protein
MQRSQPFFYVGQFRCDRRAFESPPGYYLAECSKRPQSKAGVGRPGEAHALLDRIRRIVDSLVAKTFADSLTTCNSYDR